MPSGKVHSALTLATLSGVLAPYAVVNLGGNEYTYAAGCLVGVLVMPDLDVDGGNISDTFLRKIFPPIQWVWRVFWTPYAKLVPHRSFFSHFPFVGTLLRIGYIFLIFNIITTLSSLFFDTVFQFHFFWDWSFYFGLCHVDIIHWITDNTIKGKEIFEGE